MFVVQLCKLAVGCAQQPHTEISDNIYELEEDEDNVFVEPSYGDTLEYIIYIIFCHFEIKICVSILITTNLKSHNYMKIMRKR
jgi:hypothetical protein